MYNTVFYRGYLLPVRFRQSEKPYSHAGFIRLGMPTRSLLGNTDKTRGQRVLTLLFVDAGFPFSGCPVPGMAADAAEMLAACSVSAETLQPAGCCHPVGNMVCGAGNQCQMGRYGDFFAVGFVLCFGIEHEFNNRLAEPAWQIGCAEGSVADAIVAMFCVFFIETYPR